MKIFLSEDSPHIKSSTQRMLDTYRHGDRGWREVPPEELLAAPYVKVLAPPQGEAEELRNEIAEDLRLEVQHQ